MISPNKHEICYDVYCYGDIGRNGFDETVTDNIKDSFELSPDYKSIFIIPDSSKEQEFLHDVDVTNTYGLPTYGAWVYEGNEDRKVSGRKYIQMYPYEVPILRQGDYVCFNYHLRGTKSTWLVTALDSQAIYEQIGSIQLCTNELRFYNEYGKLIRVPCVLTDSINSEKNIALANLKYINGITTLYLQMNSDSQQIKPNQRFLFGRPGNWTAFRVVSVGVDNFLNEIFWDSNTSHLMELTLEASYVNELTDDLELGIADANKFNLTVDIESITNIVGTTSQLNAELYRNGEPYSLPLIWSTENEEIATVDEGGLVSLIGEGNTVIKVSMKDNSDVFAAISVTVLADGGTLPNISDIVIYPSDGDTFGILQGNTQKFSCNMFVDGEPNNEQFDFSVDTDIPPSKFKFSIIDGNNFEVKNIKMDNYGKLSVTCTDKTNGSSKKIDIILKGAW